ncbi:hypothetical protein BKA62DRAFT_636830 [Auriculariales sp. MPI-PUGE-AT-0066]|nr:hypothetical protein BKA62DRAFT_636830 [Auriculariales sp. MPI-PUGE-AT-0066]
MSALSSLLGKTLLKGRAGPAGTEHGAMNALRYALETMPREKGFHLEHGTLRRDVFAELYTAFWGPYPHFFLPPNVSQGHALLSEVQQLAPPAVSDPHRGRSCARILAKGECCYRCKDCAIDDNFALCSQCFHATDHTGHTVTFYLVQQPGECCHCGDREVWRVPLNCRHHPVGENEPTVGNRQLDPWQSKQSARTHLPIELRDSMSRTIAYALDFVIDTLDFSPDEALLPDSETELRLQPTADPIHKELFMILVWNDEKHSFEEVLDLITDATSCSRDAALAMTGRIEEHGRAVVLTYRGTEKVLEVAHLIANIDMGVTVRRAYDTFREEMAALIIEWLLDLMRCHVVGDPLLLRELVAAELLQPRQKDTKSLQLVPEAARLFQEVENLARVDWLFIYHTRLWKRPRLHLKQMYAAILAIGHSHKLALADHFARMYTRLIDSYLLTDREAETSIKFFTLQVFTVPTIAAHCVKQHKIIDRILEMITAFFTNQISNKRVIYPPNQALEVDVDSMPFKSKRFMPIFSDLRYICTSGVVQQHIVGAPSLVKEFGKVCQMFVGINASKRAVASHVEYETDAWISVFNVTLSLSRVVKTFGEAYAHAGTKDLVGAILSVIHQILMVCSMIEPRLDRDKYEPIKYHTVTFGGNSYKIIDFSVLSGWVSFHHALHWLLAELFRHADLLTHDKLSAVEATTMREVILRQADEKSYLTVIDFPLRVITMIAQIRVGLWVRNGFAIRGQLLHYRELMLRELCYDQDLFILQTGFVVLDSDLVFVSMMDRFELRDWFTGLSEHATYEGAHLLAMVEEFLYVVIACVGETGAAAKLSLHESVRREIVHALASGACSFTDLCKRVSERMVDDVCFEKVLAEVANFRSPDGASEGGLYELKDEAYDEVNPFFFHYTRNKREEVEAILKTRIRNKTGATDPVLVPKAINVPHGPFEMLPWVMTSEALIQIMFHSVNNVLVQSEAAGAVPASADAVLDQALYLVMFGLVQHPEDFPRIVAAKTFEDKKTVWHALASAGQLPMFKTHKTRIDWCLDNCRDALPTDVQQARMDAANAEKQRRADDTEAAKKRAAQARKDAIMKQYAQQHQTFLDQLGDDDDLDEDGDRETVRPEAFGTCIVCQEDLDSSRAFGALSMVQPSRFLRRSLDSGQTHSLIIPERHAHGHKSAFPPHDHFTGSEPPLVFNGFPASQTKFGLHASECGHMMHLECFTVYTHSIRQRHRAQAQRNHPENTQRKEFICPLCKSLGNTILPVDLPAVELGPNQTFAEWLRGTGINLLRSPPERDQLQLKTGSGEFVFWAAQDWAYVILPKHDAAEAEPMHRMLDTLMHTARVVSAQSRHLRDRAEPEASERGAGMYLPEELCSYTLGCMEVAQRTEASATSSQLIDVSETSARLLRGLVASMKKLISFHFKDRPDGGLPAVRQAIIKRLLPEWRRENSLNLPLLLRDPLTIVFETAAVAPEILRYIVILCYYASVTRATLRLVSHIGKPSPSQIDIGNAPQSVDYTSIFGDIRVFVGSVARHSPTLDHTAQVIMTALGAENVNKYIYLHTLPFLRRAVMLIRALVPAALRPVISPQAGEYTRMLEALGIPAVSQLSTQEGLQNILVGWCAHYGYQYNPSPLEYTIHLEYPHVYNLIQLPAALDTLFVQEKTMVCPRCKTVPNDLAVCLICGTICCFQSHCCRDAESLGRDRGECNMHTRECGGIIGMYFLVKRCTVLYLYAGNGSFGSTPYLDVHGEVDYSMRRGRRQYLHPVRMEDVRKIWLTHGIPTFVARKLDAMIDSGGWETF